VADNGVRSQQPVLDEDGNPTSVHRRQRNTTFYEYDEDGTVPRKRSPQVTVDYPDLGPLWVNRWTDTQVTTVP